MIYISSKRLSLEHKWLVLAAAIACIAAGCNGDTDDNADEDAGSDAGADTEEDPDTDYELDAGPDSGSPISKVSIEMHEKVKTVLVVHWTQVSDADSAWLRFTFENNEWLQTPPRFAGKGENQEVILGVPEETVVTFHVVTESGGVTGETVPLTAATGAAPSAMPRATILHYDPALASEDRWMLGSVENTPDDGDCGLYYYGTFWIYIIDRRGRIVWYYSDLGDNPCMAFPRVSPDGSYIYFEKRYFANSGAYAPRVLKLTLDHSYFEEVPVPGLEDCMEMTDDGAILFNTGYEGDSNLKELLPDGTVRTIWNVEEWVQATGQFITYTNTVNWNPLNNTVTMSFPYSNTAVEIDRTSGQLIAQWGSLADSWDFSPDTWRFQFNHYANITPDGTLLISSHMPGFSDTESPVAGEHAFMEFEIDRENKTLVEKWIYNEGDEWAMYKGEAHRMANGNTLANYGTGGVIREITPDKETAWHVKWDAHFDQEDFYNNMVGHDVMINDLYALCQGPG
jgi:hypothetical protein